MHLQNILLGGALLVLVFLLVETEQTYWAVPAGQRACDSLECITLPANTSGNCDGYGSYIQGTNNLSPPFNSSLFRQLLAVPFRYSGQISFEVQTVRLFMAMPTTRATASLVVFFYAPDTANASLPGAILNGTAAEGQKVVFTKASRLTADTFNPIYELVGSIATPFNVSVGTYFVSVAAFNDTLPGSGTFTMPAFSNGTRAAYLPAYQGLNRTGTFPPFQTAPSTFTWAYFANILLCLWVEGVDYEPPSTTGGTTTTTGGSSTTTTTTGSTTGGTSTTGGGSGGDANPTDFLVRYTLNTDLNVWSPTDFISGVSATLQLTQYDSAYIYIVAARRTVVTQGTKRTVGTGTAVDFYITGPDGAALMDTALSVKLSDLQANGVDIASAPTQVSADASPASALRPPAGVLLRWLLAWP